MKKFILLTGFLLTVQFAVAQVNLGARMGMTIGSFQLENANERFADEIYDISSTINILLNLDIDIPFSTVFSFRTGLGLVIKGAEIDDVPDMRHADTTFALLYRLNYLEVPLLLGARLETDFSGNFFFGIGPTLSLGVGGRMDRFAQKIGTGQETQEVYSFVWGNKPIPEKEHGFNHIRRFELGLGAKFSYQLPRSGLTFTVSGNRGLRNISPNPDLNLRTSYIGVTIGFSMGGV